MIKIENIDVYGWEAAIPIPNHTEFKATPDGQIIGKRGKLLIGHIDRCGYREVLFSENGKTNQYRVHRLIAETFIPNPNNLPCVNHKDGDKLNNSVSNLEWCTRSENVLHAYRTGLETKMCGEKHHAHKLTEDEVKYIRQVYIKRDKEFGAVALSKRFGVDRTTIHDVVKGKTWREIA